MRWLLLVLLVVLPAAAQTPPPAGGALGTLGPGNLPPDFYPRSPCVKPDTASIGRKPGDAHDVKAVDAYNKQVAAYNQAAPAYNDCLQAYADRAHNDMERIRAAVQDANSH